MKEETRGRKKGEGKKWEKVTIRVPGEKKRRNAIKKEFYRIIYQEIEDSLYLFIVENDQLTVREVATVFEKTDLVIRNFCKKLGLKLSDYDPNK